METINNLALALASLLYAYDNPRYAHLKLKDCVINTIYRKVVFNIEDKEDNEGKTIKNLVVKFPELGSELDRTIDITHINKDNFEECNLYSTISFYVYPLYENLYRVALNEYIKENIDKLVIEDTYVIEYEYNSSEIVISNTENDSKLILYYSPKEEPAIPYKYYYGEYILDTMQGQFKIYIDCISKLPSFITLLDSAITFMETEG